MFSGSTSKLSSKLITEEVIVMDGLYYAALFFRT
ncbi:hypothetical protein swp_2877 [Shewanella piezotolerans WP3]|uniref:Uncharacterized protein n=1 Tax=Shewanella piezotolerans (strain WP3 / JCM 13877) TaxID=225849 RepID=B8CPM7_SHEPW|nr:hypothetical protein swp_2877 [Shewanella piezotolerans WP3]